MSGEMFLPDVVSIAVRLYDFKVDPPVTEITFYTEQGRLTIGITGDVRDELKKELEREVIR